MNFLKKKILGHRNGGSTDFSNLSKKLVLVGLFFVIINDNVIFVRNYVNTLSNSMIMQQIDRNCNKEDRRISFVTDVDSLRVINDIISLKSLVATCKENNIPLTNLDLSNVEIKDIDMSGLEIVNVVFNTYDVTRSGYKTISNVSFKGSKLTKVSFAQCSLERCNFDNDKPTLKELAKRQEDTSTHALKNYKTIINEGDFFMCRWESCRLRRSEVNIADFRYSEFINCSLGGCRIRLGDFYMTAFRGTTNFTDSVFMECSITNTIFENDCIRMKGIEKLVQECYEDYSNIIIGHPQWYKQNPCADFSHQNDNEDKGNSVKSKVYTHQEASVVYAQLSGLYAGKGFFKDSNLAYEKAKCNEAWSRFYDLKDKFSNLVAPLNDEKRNTNMGGIGKNLFSLLKFAICWTLGFGYKLKNVVACIIILVIGYTLLFHVKSDCSFPWYNELAFSLNNTIGPYEKFMEVVDIWLSSIQTTIGILLIGFAGFVIANRVRSNY